MKIIKFHQTIAQIMLNETRPIPVRILVQKIKKTIHSKDERSIEISIQQMIDNGELKQLTSKSLVIKHLVSDELASNEQIEGIIKINASQNGFVYKENEKEASFFVPKNKLNGALDGDKVLISPLKMYLTNNDKENNFVDAQVNEIIEHKKNYFTATFKILEPNKYFVKVDDPKFYFNVILRDISNLTNNAKILFEVEEYKEDVAYGEVKKIIGHESDVGNDILSLVYNVGIEPEFSEQILKEADKLKIEWDPKNPKNRKDLTDKNFITIDPASSKDFDDSFYLEKKEDGTFILNIAIADVGHFIKYNSILANEALKRGTSIYLTDRVIPMYPHYISDDLCSINPNVVRFSMNCEMHIDQLGNIKKIDVYPAAIKSKRRFSYDEVNALFDNKDELKNDDQNIILMLKNAKELHDILRKKKQDEGFIDFDIKEPIIIVNEKGKAVDIKLYETGEAQKMIEDFMIAANEAVTIFALKHKLPFIFRTHDQPEPLKIEEFNKLLKRIDFNSRLDLSDITNKKIADWLRSNENHKMIDIARTLLLHSMQKAKYSEELKQHFGIASKNYTHFTSPIRRFPDTLVSQLFHMYLFNKDEYSDEDRNNIKKQINEFANIANEREIIATKLGFDVNEMKFAEYMIDHLDENYIGMITSVNKFGVFVQLANTIEGLIHIKNMNNDFYNYQEETSTLIGRNTRMELHVGDKVEVKVIGANKDTRKIDFSLVNKIEQ